MGLMKKTSQIILCITFLFSSCGSVERIFAKKLTYSVEKENVKKFNSLIYEPHGIYKEKLNNEKLVKDLIDSYVDISKHFKGRFSIDSVGTKFHDVNEKFAIGKIYISYKNGAIVKGEVVKINGEIKLLEKFYYRNVKNETFGFVNL
jgi:hypothetical protein